MSGSRFTPRTEKHQFVTPPRPINNAYATRFMLNQALTTFGNGLAKDARTRLGQQRGFRPYHPCHPDREVFSVVKVAPRLFPDNRQAQQRLIEMNWDSYARGPCREAINSLVSFETTTPAATPVLQPA